MNERETPNVGGRIRILREEKNFSLRALAQRCGLSINAISRIERGETSPTVSSLHMLATALEVAITDLFSDDNSHLAVFVSRDHRLKSISNGFSMESLGLGLRNQQIEPFLITLQPGESQQAESVVHSGQEFAYCLEGALEYTIDGTVYRLRPGDSILFEATQPHCFRNSGDEPVRFIVIFGATDGNHIARKRHFDAQSTQTD